MRIHLSSVLVDDQQKALTFYTEVLGFKKKADVPIGEYRWITVTSSDDPDAVELVLEPMGFPLSVTYQKALFDAGIPITAFIADDIEYEYFRLLKLGVKFLGEPKNLGTITAVMFEDTCGNLINLVQPH